MSKQDLFVSVVAALSNDADIVEPFVEETAAMLEAQFGHWEIILVDDGSTDDTLPAVDRLIARHPRCRLLRLSRRFGAEIAIAAGLETAIGDYVVVMTPATDPPERVPEMVDRCRDGAGIVTGIRTTRAGEPAVLRLGARTFYGLANRVLGLHIPPNSTHFKVLSRQVVNAIMQIRDRNRFLRTLSVHVGYAAAECHYAPIARRRPPRAKTFKEALYLAVNIVVTNTVQPLYLAAAVGMAVVAANALYLVYVVAVYLTKPDVAAGWTTESAVMAVMFGALAFIGTVGVAYLARLVDERSDRPLYFVLEERTAATPDIERQRNVVSESGDRGRS